RYIHHRRAVSTAVDGDGDASVSYIAVGITHLVIEGLGQSLTVIQSVDRRVGVVQHIGVGAIGIGGEVAVVAGGAGPAIEGDRAVECAVVGQGITADGIRTAVFDQGMQLALGHGVGVGNQHVQSVVAGLAVGIGDADNEAIQYRVITSGVILCAVDGVAVVDLAGDCIVAGKGQFALGGGHDRWRSAERVQVGEGQGLTADLQAGNAGLCGDGDLTGDGSGGIFGDAVVTRCHAVVIRYIDHRRAIGTAVDVDGDAGVIHIAIGITHLIAECLGQSLTVIQNVDRRVGVVQHIAVGAIGIGGEAAVLAGGAGPAIEGDRAVQGAVVGQGVTADGIRTAVLDNKMGLAVGYRVGVGNQYVQSVVAGLAVCIGDADGKGVDDRVIASGVILSTVDGVAVVDLAGDCIVAGKGQFALGSGHDRWRSAERVQLGEGQGLTADLQAGKTCLGGDGYLPCCGSGSIFGDADVTRCHTVVIRYIHHRRAVSTAVDGDGDASVSYIAVGITHLVIEGLGQSLTVIQSVDRRVGVVQHIGVGAIGIGGEVAVVAGGAGPAIESDRAVEGAVVGQGISTDGICTAVFDQDVGFTLGYGVGVGDQYVQGVVAGLTVGIGDADSEAIQYGVIASVVILSTVDGVAVVDHAGDCIVAGEGQFALGGGYDRWRSAERVQLGEGQGLTANLQTGHAGLRGDGDLTGDGGSGIFGDAD